MSAATGAFGNRIAVTGNPADPILKDRDVLLVGAMPALLADINEDDALKVQEETAKAFKAGQFPKPPQQSIFAPGVGVISGFKSPLSSEHSVVALLAEGEAGAVVLADALGDAQGLAAAGGSTTVVSMDGLAASVSATVMQWGTSLCSIKSGCGSHNTPAGSFSSRSFPPRSSVLPPSSLCAAGSVGEHDV